MSWRERTLLGLRAESIGVRHRCAVLLHDVDLDLPGVGMVGLSGPSGSGKTTLLGVLGGAIGSVGDVRCEFAGSSERPQPKLVSWIFQMPRAMGSHRAWEIAATPLLLAGESAGHARGRAVELLERVGVGALADVRFSRLSGGERQRVLISRALLEDKPILLADEPTAALDRPLARLVASLLHDVARRRLVVVASHDADVWEQCTVVHRLDAGALA